MPNTEDSADLEDYTEAVLDGIGPLGDLLVDARSVGAFVGPLVCERASGAGQIHDADHALPSASRREQRWQGDFWGSRNVRSLGPRTRR